MEGVRLQLNGYCLITILKKGGLLLYGDPKAGIAQVGENSFLFANTDCLNEYASCLVSNVKYVGKNSIYPWVLYLLKCHGVFFSFSNSLGQTPL